MTIEADGSLKKPIVTQWELIPSPVVSDTTTVQPVTSISSKTPSRVTSDVSIDADKTLVGDQGFTDLASGGSIFQQYVAIINHLRGRAMIHLVPPEDRKVTQRVSKALAEHPLVLLDQRLQSLVREDDNAISPRQPPRGRR